MANPVPVTYSAANGAVLGGKTAPKVAVGSYVGTGAAQDVTLGWRPDLVVVRGGSRAAVYHTSLGWHDRSNYLINDDSLYMVTFSATGFSVNASRLDVNQAGTTFHYLAIADNGSGLLQDTAWIGNLTDGRQIEVADNLIDLVFVKRDSPRAAAIKHRAMPDNVSMLSTGGAGTYIRRIAHGTIEIDASLPVNENDGPATVGEGMEGVAFCRSPFSRLVTWTGNGAATRQIAAGITPSWGLIIRSDGSAPLPEIVTSTAAPGTSFPLSATAANTGRVSLAADGISLDSATFNASGVSYAALLLAEYDPAVSEPAPAVSGKYLQLSGSSSAIRFGKNAALDVGGGPFSLEWFGRRMTSGACIPLWMRGNGTISGTHASNAGEYSWGLFVYPPVDPYSHGWQGDVFRIVHSNYLAATLTESDTNRYSWNTGIVAPLNEDMHLVLTHNGAGLWKLYLNGRCIKQRDMDMTTVQWGQRSNAGTGNHDALIGARMAATGETLYDSRQMRIYLARIYARALSSDDVRARYRRAVQGASVPDVQPAEEWAFTDGSGATLTATINTANNATVVGGTWGDR